MLPCKECGKPGYKWVVLGMDVGVYCDSCRRQKNKQMQQAVPALLGLPATPVAEHKLQATEVVVDIEYDPSELDEHKVQELVAYVLRVGMTCMPEIILAYKDHSGSDAALAMTMKIGRTYSAKELYS